MKKCDEDLKQIFFKLCDIDEILREQKNWLDIAICYCENNPDNEESPAKLNMIINKILDSNNKLLDLNDLIIENLHKLH